GQTPAIPVGCPPMRGGIPMRKWIMVAARGAAMAASVPAWAQVGPGAEPRPTPKPAATRAPRPAPAVRMSQSPDPTFDEGTIQRIAAAMLSYTVLEVQGGWPTLPASAGKLAPGARG